MSKSRTKNNLECLEKTLHSIQNKKTDSDKYSFGRVVCENGDRRFTVRLCIDKTEINARVRGSLRGCKRTSIRIRKNTPVIIYDSSEIFAFFDESNDEHRKIFKFYTDVAHVIPSSIKDTIVYDGGDCKHDDLPYEFVKSDDEDDTTHTTVKDDDITFIKHGKKHVVSIDDI